MSTMGEPSSPVDGEILFILRHQGSKTAAELATRFAVSLFAMRGRLRSLENTGRVKRGRYRGDPDLFFLTDTGRVEADEFAPEPPP